MCYHSRAEFDAYVASLGKVKKRNKAGKGHAKSEDKYAVIVLRDEVGEWVAGWHCDPRDAQDVANTILDLKTWHEGEYRFVDTTNIDEERVKLKLAPLDQAGLPIPSRVAGKSIDKDLVHDLNEKWDIENKSAIPPGGLNSLVRSVKVRRERDAEIAALAAELGVSVEEVKAKAAIEQR